MLARCRQDRIVPTPPAPPRSKRRSPADWTVHPTPMQCATARSASLEPRAVLLRSAALKFR